MRLWGQDLWTSRYVDALLPGVVRRVLDGAEPQPRYLWRRVLTVVSVDVDTAAGVGAVWIVWRPKSRRARQHTALLEWYDERWRCPGAAIGPADDPTSVDVIEVRGGAGTLSLTRRLDVCSVSPGTWISCAEIHVGPGVGHILIGDRRIDAPQQGRLIAAWKCPYTERRKRPLIVAAGHDGTELSRMGPLDGLDSNTWARVRRYL
ncbi:hypothetical protein ABZ883_20255 [Streptomyces sp. NPDC046977]|uniref:hypothetical protein n=1 Tax=Streptomyces sp. NPDC046977 TaxID=3154703 RepID=UPI0033C45148